MKNSLFKISIISAAFACTQISSAAFAQNNSRSGFLPIKVQEFISSKRISVTTPNQVAVQLFSYTEEQEGRKSEQVSVAYPTRESAVILHTEEGLADDSVAAKRQRIELRRTQNKWQIVWVGQQFKCNQGRGNQNWSSQLCR